jgi:myosin protein heavy chain
MNLNEVDFDSFINQINNDPDLKEAVLNPTIIDNSIESLNKVSDAMSLPLLICEKPDIELPKIKTQLNFQIPNSMKKSKDPYVVSLRDDINMYRKLYEKHSKRINEIIEKTKKSIILLFPQIKDLHNEIKSYTNDFENSIKKLYTPYQNKINILNQVNYKNFQANKQKEFKEDKDKVINEINEFLKDINDYYANYDQMNKKTLSNTERFVEKFNHLAKPAKELTLFMRTFCTKFEKSSEQFNDLKNKEKVDKALQNIKEPINDYIVKFKDLETILGNVKEEEIQQNIIDINSITSNIKKIIKNMKEKSEKISKLIKNIMEKYELTKQKLEQMDIGEPPAPINTSEINEKIQKQGDEINDLARRNMKNLGVDAINIINQSRLDLLFIIDITNSMDYYLDEAKNGMLGMIKEIQKQCAGSGIFLGFIGYKDFSDLDFGEKYINLEFTNKYESLIENIKYLKAEGGGDVAEDLCGGLEMGQNKEWSGKSRFAILVTDAPCHGKKYHDLAEDEDNFPEGDKKKRNIEDYIKFFAENEISLYCLKINNTTDKMFKIFKDVYDNNKNKNSKCEFIVQEGKKIFNIVTENAVKIFRNRKKVEIKE